MSIVKNLKNINFKSQKQQEKEKSQSLFLGAIIGTVIGTVAGVFMQTDKGKKARKEVANKAKDISKKSKVVLYDSVNKLKATKNKVIEKVKNRNQEENVEEIEENVIENN